MIYKDKGMHLIKCEQKKRKCYKPESYLCFSNSFHNSNYLEIKKSLTQEVYKLKLCEAAPRSSKKIKGKHK